MLIEQFLKKSGLKLEATGMRSDLNCVRMLYELLNTNLYIIYFIVVIVETFRIDIKFMGHLFK